MDSDYAWLLLLIASSDYRGKLRLLFTAHSPDYLHPEDRAGFWHRGSPTTSLSCNNSSPIVEYAEELTEETAVDCTVKDEISTPNSSSAPECSSRTDSFLSLNARYTGPAVLEEPPALTKPCFIDLLKSKQYQVGFKLFTLSPYLARLSGSDSTTTMIRVGLQQKKCELARQDCLNSSLNGLMGTRAQVLQHIFHRFDLFSLLSETRSMLVLANTINFILLNDRKGEHDLLHALARLGQQCQMTVTRRNNTGSAEIETQPEWKIEFKEFLNSVYTIPELVLAFSQWIALASRIASNEDDLPPTA
ncbi:hypothetical protein ACTXT7_007998 [Hymenolepis weldensis]